jgi:hypothetical protein
MSEYENVFLEIFTNPHDLIINLLVNQASGEYRIEISRESSSNFRPLLTSKKFVASEEDAIGNARLILLLVHEEITQKYVNRHRLAFDYFEADKRTLNQSKVLTLELIEKITMELRGKHKRASTREIQMAR